MSEFTKTVSDSDFQKDILESKVPVLVDFWAPWCGPCVAIGPTLEELAQEYQDKLVVAKMNVDENANIPAQFGVRSIPFMVFIKEGKVVESIVGAQPKAKIKEIIDRVV